MWSKIITWLGNIVWIWQSCSEEVSIKITSIIFFKTVLLIYTVTDPFANKNLNMPMQCHQNTMEGKRGSFLLL